MEAIDEEEYEAHVHCLWLSIASKGGTASFFSSCPKPAASFLSTPDKPIPHAVKESNKTPAFRISSFLPLSYEYQTTMPRKSTSKAQREGKGKGKKMENDSAREDSAVAPAADDPAPATSSDPPAPAPAAESSLNSKPSQSLPPDKDGKAGAAAGEPRSFNNHTSLSVSVSHLNLVAPPPPPSLTTMAATNEADLKKSVDRLEKENLEYHNKIAELENDISELNEQLKAARTSVGDLTRQVHLSEEAKTEVNAQEQAAQAQVRVKETEKDKVKEQLQQEKQKSHGLQELAETLQADLADKENQLKRLRDISDDSEIRLRAAEQDLLNSSAELDQSRSATEFLSVIDEKLSSVFEVRVVLWPLYSVLVTDVAI